MRKRIATALVALALLGPAPAAHAGTAVDVALGLAAFAVFNQLLGWWPQSSTERVIVYAPPPTYVTGPPGYSALGIPSGSAPVPTAIEYPHGRYELRGDGIQTAYQWVWIPRIPPPPPPPPLAPPPSITPPLEPPTGIQGMN